ncbi:lytic transglycosylase domain-containing protein [Streptomyces pinistramenti]|uniref:lytic transglycosylase domain-containing protein n=1 Tax=Streptomyces pinistramenti TaxID=2884812 RepID=UPI001D073A36|nr:lytic transglycosylase [Streptomyces pinistramenti]MCB5907190.1 lytic transglycosylase [Streptomyces pinistramenti]
MAAIFGRRLRRGAASAAVTGLVLAALTASQAPGVAGTAAAKEPEPGPPADASIDGGSSFYTDLPPRNSPTPPGDSGKPGGGEVVTGPAEAGIPATVLAAYKKAEAGIGASDPGCRLPWQLLAAIGKVESGQARGGAVDADGTTLKPILGPQLNGDGFALITDTDHGRYDGDLTHDRAVGPMQFIPSTWSNGGPDGTGWGADGNGDGKKDPNNIFDAALAAGHYLCNGGRDLAVPRDLDRAILGYNNSEDYLRTVLSWYTFYRKGTHEVPDGKGLLPVRRGGTSTGSGDSGQGARDGKVTGAHPGDTLAGTRKPAASKPGTEHGDKNKPENSTTSGSTGTGGTGGTGSTGGTGGTPGNDGSSGTGGTGGTEGSTGGTPTPTHPADPAPLTALERVGGKELTATAGDEFSAPPQVRAKDAAGKPVTGAPVRFTLSGPTDTRFPDDATAVTVTTGKDGLATAPALRAGKKAGGFTVRAAAVGRSVAPVDFGATVKARPAPKADALARTSDKELTTAAGGTYAADTIEVKATYRGKIAAGAAVTATMITDDPKKPVENEAGPYFKDPQATGDAADKPVRTLTTLRTDADGLLKLPAIHTDSHTGTFLLRLTTADGATLTVELKVTAPAGA